MEELTKYSPILASGLFAIYFFVKWILPLLKKEGGNSKDGALVYKHHCPDHAARVKEEEARERDAEKSRDTLEAVNVQLAVLVERIHSAMQTLSTFNRLTDEFRKSFERLNLRVTMLENVAGIKTKIVDNDTRG